MSAVDDEPLAHVPLGYASPKTPFGWNEPSDGEVVTLAILVFIAACFLMGLTALIGMFEPLIWVGIVTFSLGRSVWVLLKTESRIARVCAWSVAISTTLGLLAAALLWARRH